MKCLVTGAGGYIGNSLVRRLVNDGHEVSGLINKSKPKISENKATYIQGDITKIDAIKNKIKDVEIIFHCASIVKDYGSKKNFYKVNFEGTKNLVELSESIDIKRFIFIGHIGYEPEGYKSNYAKTKDIAEKYLLKKYETENFPIVVIRPGNVFGPGAETWVLRPFNAILKNRISLIDNGTGIFHHTYIDNLLDCLIAAISNPKVIGKVIDVTDGDDTVTWKKYFNDLAKIAGKQQIKKNMSKNMATNIAKIMLFLNLIFRIKPWITPTAVGILTNKKSIYIKKAQKLLDYEPKIDYETAMKKIKKWLKDEIAK
jgi:nucleoside-diphosphate-sugar epimerase